MGQVNKMGDASSCQFDVDALKGLPAAAVSARCGEAQVMQRERAADPWKGLGKLARFFVASRWGVIV